MNFYEVAILGKPLLFTYQSEQSLSPGDVVRVRVKSRLYDAVVIQTRAKPTFECLPIEEVTPYYYSADQLAIAKFVATYYFSSLAEALALFVPCHKDQRRSQPLEARVPALSKAQQEALEFLKDQDVALLFGDTGSGKTQIYMAYFAQVLKEGKEAIFLMPEISLTPQMQKRLEALFGDSVVVWHSKLTKKQRQEALEAIYAGRAKIVAGPRSALFLPLKNLGLIVVDEEHDESYKAQSRPRLNAKDLAVYMGKKLGIPVVLGSATPSVVSYHRYPSFRLRGSFFEGKKEFVFDSGDGLSQEVLDHIEEVLDRGKQALIFLPTRAHFKYLICQECAETVKCPYCDVGMSVHFDKRALVCHYCNYSQYIPSSCPSCGASDLSAKRLGTSEVVETLRSVFVDARVEKFDKDSASTHKKLTRLLDDFSSKKIDILVGTQMLSKGHDYPDVALSVILDIDYVLAQADFRARERALALCLQIAGRAGRKEDAKVVIQTKKRDFFARYLDFELFLQEELEYRKGLYPPFMRLAHLLFAHKDPFKAREGMEEVLRNLEKFADVQIVGYGPSAIERIAGKFRYHILLRSHSAKALLQAIHASKNDLCEVDMDPVNLV
ncbi:MAG: primosomal protein N' [Epsilonproteobacteria bacterium]|nr:primosomal protein N' [Campylobacterota bacterium]NPA63591.1 primosomal protein N' [Campylobacterota bacterium]